MVIITLIISLKDKMFTGNNANDIIEQLCLEGYDDLCLG